MAWIHPPCGRVHPEGAITCEQARQMIEKRGRGIEHEMTHHRGKHPHCIDPYTCIIRERHRQEEERRERQEPWSGIIGASI